MAEEGNGPGACLHLGTKGVLRCAPWVLLGGSALQVGDSPQFPLPRSQR